ncbi:MAG: DUF4942 domain-containing protein [Patescibacteria group bacterium]
MEDLIVRPNIADLYRMKLEYLENMSKLAVLDRDIHSLITPYNGYLSYDIKWGHNFRESGRNLKAEECNEKYIDRIIWGFLVKSYQLGKYMLCTKYSDLKKSIENYESPVFNPENAIGWLSVLKEDVYENIEKLIVSVYQELITGTYHTGNGCNNRVKKKRNNSGVDTHFILGVSDYYYMNRECNLKPTFTDDLEKACYLLDGKKIPDITLKQRMYADKQYTGENEYMKIVVYQTSNTHYTLNEEIRAKFNRLSDNAGKIGKDIGVKIKIFE